MCKSPDTFVATIVILALAVGQASEEFLLPSLVLLSLKVVELVSKNFRVVGETRRVGLWMAKTYWAVFRQVPVAQFGVACVVDGGGPPREYCEH